MISGKWLYYVVRNSIQCTKCQKTVHKKCGGIKDSTIKMRKCFVCRGCTDQPTSTNRNSVHTGDGASLQLVYKLIDLGYKLSADGKVDAMWRL